MKKCISWLLTVVLLCTASGFTAFGAPSAQALTASSVLTFTMGNVTCEAGQTVDLPVTISNNPGICTAKLTISYDKNQLELINVTNGTVITDGFTPGGSMAAVPFSVVWNSGTKIVTGNGTVVTFTFRMKSVVSAGTKAVVTLSGSEYDICDENLDPVAFETVNGSVSVPVVLSSIAVKSMPNKTQYFVGESFNQSGLSLTATYSDNSTKTISSGFACTGFSSSSAGTKTVTVSYTEGGVTKTTSFNVTVVNITLTNIAVKTNPTKTQYFIGESFNQSGLTLMATYSNGSTKTITSGFTCTGFSSSSTGTKTVTVSYTEGGVTKKTSFNVTIINITLTGIAVKTNPTKTKYYLGESFDQSGLTLTATYSNGSTKTITSGFTCTGFSSSSTGKKTITVTYEGKTTTFTVEVKSGPTISIENYVKERTVDYKTTITFTAVVDELPAGTAVYWLYCDISNPSDVRWKKGYSFTVQQATATFNVQALIVDKDTTFDDDDPVYASSEMETVYVKDGFFARLKAFFRSIFGRLPNIVQDYLGVEIIDNMVP